MTAVSSGDPTALLGLPEVVQPLVRMSTYNLPCPASLLMPASDLGPLPLSSVPLGGGGGGSQLKTFSLFPQTSLNKLLETLGKAEPFFIRCIRSNAEKVSSSSVLGK